MALRLGQLSVEFAGDTLWARKAHASFLNQVGWLDVERAQSFFPIARHYVFRQSDQPGLNEATGATVLNLDRWYNANASLIFQLEAVLQGALLVHGNAFARNGQVHVFAADGGVGKTSMLLAFQQHSLGEVEFVGDDLVWLTKNGLALAYLRPMCVYKYHYKNNSGIFADYPIHFLFPAIFAKVVRLVARNITSLFGSVKMPLTNHFAPSDDYALVPVSAVYRRVASARALPLASFNYLRKGPAFGETRLRSSELLSATLQSLLKEFKDYLPILDQATHEWRGSSFSSYASALLETLLDSRKGSMFETSGRWSEKEIADLLTRLSE